MVVKSLRLVWIGRLLGESDDKWKAIPNYFRNYGGLLFLLKCSLKKRWQSIFPEKLGDWTRCFQD